MSSIRWVIFVISYSLLLEKVPYIFTSFRFFDFFNSFPLFWPHMFHRLFAMLFFKKGPHYDLVFGLTIFLCLQCNAMSSFSRKFHSFYLTLFKDYMRLYKVTRFQSNHHNSHNQSFSLIPYMVYFAKINLRENS